MDVGIKHGLDLLAVNQKSANIIEIKKRKFTKPLRYLDNTVYSIMKNKLNL